MTAKEGATYSGLYEIKLEHDVQAAHPAEAFQYISESDKPHRGLKLWTTPDKAGERIELRLNLLDSFTVGIYVRNESANMTESESWKLLYTVSETELNSVERKNFVSPGFVHEARVKLNLIHPPGAVWGNKSK